MYSPLSPDKRQIRLLRLLPGTGAEDIKCELYPTSLDNPDEYEALSYVWGSSHNPLPIVIQQESKHVTRNLESALRHMRCLDRPRTLWVDAVCINQDDLHEKSTQIQYMGLIYSEAFQVLVWLGEENDHALESIAIIRKLAADKDLHWTDEGLNMNLLILFKFLANEWWSRIWTVQEAVLAKQITFQVGGLQLSDRTMYDMVASFHTHNVTARCCNLHEFWTLRTSLAVDLDLGNLMTRLQNFVRFKADCRGGGLPFEDVAAEFRTRDATNPRDKVYGLLGISHGVSVSLVDYSLTTPRVFESATREILNCRRTLNALIHCDALFSASERDKPSSRRKETVGLPSWVPDWGAQGVPIGGSLEVITYRMRFLSAYNTCAHHPYVQKEGCEPGILKVSGLLCDKVEKIGGETRDSMIFWAIDFLLKWRRLLGIDEQPSRPYIAGGSISNAFWRTVLMDISPLSGMSTPNHKKVKRAMPEDHELYNLLMYSTLLKGKRLPRPDFLEGDRRVDMTREHIVRTTCRRQFFVTEKGFIGLGPLDTKIGDKVCVSGGGKMPFVVRDLSGGQRSGQGPELENRCQMLGNAYVHGLMDGEAMKKVDYVEELETFHLC